MAKIPYVGLNSPFGNRGPDRTTPMNADTRGIGSGLAEAAGAIADIGGSVSKMLQERKAKEDEAALMDYEVKASEIENRILLDPNEGALTQRGQNAIGVRERAVGEYESQTAELKAGLNGAVKERAEMLDKRRRIQIESSLFQHETQESEKYQASQAVAGIENSVNNAGLYYTDPDRIKWEATRAKTYAEKLADMRGDAVDAETRTKGVNKAVSDVYAGVIDRKLQDDPYEAERFLAENQDKLTAEALVAARDKVDPYVRAVEYDQIAANIVAGTGSRMPGDFGSLVESVLETEGGYAATDGNSGAPVNFGINQKANPDIDVANLTREQATEIYRSRYWNAAGIDSAPAAVRGQMFDTAVNMGVETAKSLFKKSGGDPVKFAELRRERYQAIVDKDPSQAKYLQGWLARVDKYAGTEAFPPPKTAAEAVAIVRKTVANPRIRRELESRVRFEFSLKEEAERQAQQDFAMGAYDKITKSDGRTPLEKLFTPEEMRQAYKYGYYDNFQSLHRMKALGEQPQTDVTLYETLKREALLAPESFAKRNLTAISAKLGTDDLARLMGWQAEIKKPGAGQPEYISEQKQLTLAYTDMGLDGKGKGDARTEFEKAYFKEVEALAKSSGKKPTQQQRQEIINRMKLPFVEEGLIWDTKVPAYKAEPGKAKVPDADRERIAADLQKAGVTVTEARITEVYLKSAGSDL